MFQSTRFKSPISSDAVQMPAFSMRSDWLFLAVILGLALAIRLDFLIANNFVIDADEAIVGLMAKHISEFRNFPIFYYGQHYMGSFEPLVAAVLFLLFGVSSVALKMVPLLFSLIFVLLIYQLGLEIGSRAVARAAALLVAIPPQLLVVWSGMARGGFIEVVCIGTLAFILTLRWVRAAIPQPGQTAGIGVVLGFGWWVNNQTLYFMLPIAFAMTACIRMASSGTFAAKCRALVVHAVIGIFGFLLGGLPYWIYNISHRFISLDIAHRAPLSDIAEHVSGLTDTALPMLLGARRQWHSEELFPHASLLAYTLYGALFAVLLFVRWREILGLFTLKINRRVPLELFMLFLLGTFAIFAISSYGSLVESPRYLLPVYVAVSILAASAIGLLSARIPVLGFTALTVLLCLNVASSYLGGRGLPGEPFVFKGERVTKDQSELIDWLQRRGINLVRTNYWIGYRLAFESKERVRFGIYQTPETVRIQEYEDAANLNGRSFLPLVLVPTQAQLVARAYDLEGYSYSRAELSGYVVIFNIAPRQAELTKIPDRDLVASASDAPAQASKAIDGIFDTRWGSGRPQEPGMNFTVSLGKPRNLRGVRYDLGKWAHDEPRALGIDLELADGTTRKLLSPEDYPSVKFTRERETAMLFNFEPLTVKKVILKQSGTDKIFDWSIAELELLE
jgi:4-amino-4-deoxy-L-arabinose transferase-like glycosyltransferase